MSDAQQGWSFSRLMTFTDANSTPQQGEVMLEHLSVAGGEDVVPQFTPVTFTNAYYTLGGQQQALATAPELFGDYVVNTNDIMQVYVSSINQATFTDAWVSY